MRFNPITASQEINDTYRNYIKSTFFIKDDELRQAYFSELEHFDFARGPYLEVVDAFEQSASLKDLVEEGLLSPLFPKLLKDDESQYTRRLYAHQEDAIRVALGNQHMVVTTGTGSGKTECFLYPILHHLLEEERHKTLGPGVRVLLLYPMNALANDQMKRLRALLANYPTITFGAYTGETEETYKDALSGYRKLHNGEDPLKNELISREEMKVNPPHILVTNYAMLEYLLLRPSDTVFFDDSRFGKFWKYIVLDEAHVYSGASGMEVSILIRRLLHRLQNPEAIRFILTSATLGGRGENEAITHFASALCGEQEFNAEAIIRAKRRVMDFEGRFTGTSDLYSALAELITDSDFKNVRTEEEQKDDLLAIIRNQSYIPSDVYNPAHSIQEILYDVFSRDRTYQWIRSHLTQGSKSLKELELTSPLPLRSLIDFISIASYALKSRGKLLDSRYHHFIRTLEGAYVTFSPKRTLSLTPKRTMIVDEIEYRAFKLSVCQYCGELYLEGAVDKGVFIQEDGAGNTPFLVLRDGFIDLQHDDIDKAASALEDFGREYTLCVQCGSVARRGERLHCSCSAHTLPIRQIKTNEDDSLLHTCAYCQSTNSKGSVLRGFYLGQDASTAVVGSALFEQIPETVIKSEKKISAPSSPFQKRKHVEEERKTRQILLFSDSRQDAAYFAPYFKYTYDVIFHRRVMMAAARDRYAHYSSVYKSGIPITHFMEEMEHHYYSTDGSTLDPVGIKKRVWKSLVNELMDKTRNSIHSIGLFHYSLDERSLFEGAFESDSITLTEDEFNTILHYILEFCMDHGALAVDEHLHLNSADWKEIAYSESEPFMLKEGNVANSKGIVSDRNAIAQFIHKGLGVDRVEIKNFLDQLFDQWLITKDIEILIPSKNNSKRYKINPQRVIVSLQEDLPKDLYQCSVCGRITTINLRGVCPAYRCSGTLTSFNLNDTDVKDYFIDQYGPNSLIYPIEVKEHTAQLSKEKAAEYQQKFIEGSINILSCSTTFEMGVDVGDLETIFMKNMPPRPSNYIQRAGRAGRRLDSAAFSLTFCRLSPHDFYYYSRPEQMINGQISPPMFKVDNPKIVQRHLFAVLLSWYWRALGPEFRRVDELFGEGGLEQIQEYLINPPEAILAYLNKIIPQSLKKHIPLYIDHYREEALPAAYNQYLNDIYEYQAAYDAEDQKEKKNHGFLGWLDKMRNTYETEGIIPFYSRNNLIPKYGFPVDTVTLFTQAPSSYRNPNSNLSLQRDLTQAISEYAPGSEVIADGYMYRSRYIKRPPRAENEWKEQVVTICSQKSCQRISVDNYTGQERHGTVLCPSCGQKTAHPAVMIIPESGFIIEPITEAVQTKKPSKTPRTTFYYIGSGKEKSQAKVYTHKSQTLSVISSPDDELLVMNKADFNVCPRCGYSVVGKGKPVITKEHDTPRGSSCGNKILSKRSLGHIFKTDVALISTNRFLEFDQAITVLYALLSGCSEYYDVERNDIDGCISYQSYGSEGGQGGITFVLFDSVPGGAGNVKRIYDSDEQSFKNFLKASLNLVQSCDCGTDGDAVCYRCLCTFRNQYYQEKMQRRYAIDFLRELL